MLGLYVWDYDPAVEMDRSAAYLARLFVQLIKTVSC